MAHLTIHVPAGHVDALRQELLRAQETAEEVEAADLEEAIEQIGAPGDLELTAHPEVLSDAVHGLLAAAIAELARAVDRYWRGADAGAEVTDRLAAVTTLVELFGTVQDG